MPSSCLSPRLTSEWVCASCLCRLRPRRAFSARRYTSEASGPARKDSQKLPSNPARTRFAPSPTGLLHLGSLRTALFNYLIAKTTAGQFLLRIEDTDTKRTVPGALERICQDLEWAGLQWDEGPEVGGAFGPYVQSERTEIYQSHASKLLDSGHAYRCFCSAERLNELAQARAKLGLPTDYDRTCASIGKAESDDRAHKGDKFTVRLKVPSVYPNYNDLIYGRVGKGSRKGALHKHGETVYEDPILLKSDGLPTYHLANVVDDHLMEITHVVRAAEWMPSTPKHLALYEAFGWSAPTFAHVGLLQDSKGQKLSKRNADIDIGHYRKAGYFPEALLNFCALLGWSHARGDDLMSQQELVENFDLKFTKGNTVVSFKKLDYLQRLHAQRYIESQGREFEEMVKEIIDLLEQKMNADTAWSLPAGKDERAYVVALLRADAKKYVSSQMFLESNRAFFTNDIARPTAPTELEADAVRNLHEKLRQISESDWRKEAILSAIAEVVDEQVKLVETSGIDEQKKAVGIAVHRYLRWAILSSPGPPMADAMEILGRSVSLRRLG